jgi:hypothetical protein
VNQSRQDWLVEPGAQHPLANPRHAKVLFASLPKGDSIAVLQRITRWTREIAALADMPLPQQLEVLDSLDQLAKNHQVNLVPEYLDTARMRKLSETRLWSTSFEFWKAIGEAYLNCMRRYQGAGPAAEAFKPKLPLVVCRAIRSLTLQLKWTLLRYARVEERIWRELCQAYVFSARWDFASRRSVVYPGRHGESSAQEEILKALMLHMSGPDTLSPLQQHIAERLVAHFAQHFAMHTTPGPGCGYVFDMSMHLPPSRARKGASPAPLLRFFGPGTAAEGMLELANHLQRQGTVPPDTPFSRLPAKDIAEVLEHLLRCWSESPPARRGRRRATVSRIVVVPGLASTAQWLQRMVVAGEGAVEPPKESESWVVVDASDGGYGAVVSREPGDWLTVGALVGVRTESANTCHVGFLRRIGSGATALHRVGIQRVGDEALPVALFSLEAQNISVLTDAGEGAILVSRRPDAEGAVEVFLRPGAFVHNKVLLMRYRSQVFRVERLETIEATPEYQRVRFRVVKEV